MATSSPHTTVDSNPAYTGTMSSNLATNGANPNLAGSVQGNIGQPYLPVTTNPQTGAITSSGYSYNASTGQFTSPNSGGTSFTQSGVPVATVNPGLFNPPASGISSSAMVPGFNNTNTGFSTAASAITTMPQPNPYQPMNINPNPQPQPGTSSQNTQTYQSPTAPIIPPSMTPAPANSNTQSPTGNTQTTTGGGNTGGNTQTTTGGGNTQDNSQNNNGTPNFGAILNQATNTAAGYAMQGYNSIVQIAQSNLQSAMYQIGAQFDGQKAATDANYSAASQNLNFQANNAVGAAVGMEAQMGQFGGSTWNNAYSSKIAGYYAMAQSQMNANWDAADRALNDNDIAAYMQAQQQYGSIIANANQQVYSTLAGLSTNLTNGLISNYYQQQNLGLKQESTSATVANTMGGYTNSNGEWVPTVSGQRLGLEQANTLGYETDPSTGQKVYTVSGLNAAANQARVSIENANLSNTTTTLANGAVTKYQQISGIMAGVNQLLSTPNALQAPSTIGDDFSNFINKPGSATIGNEATLFPILQQYASLMGISPSAMATQLSSLSGGSTQSMTNFLNNVKSQTAGYFDYQSNVDGANPNLAPYLGSKGSSNSVIGTTNSLVHPTQQQIGQMTSSAGASSMANNLGLNGISSGSFNFNLGQ